MWLLVHHIDSDFVTSRAMLFYRFAYVSKIEWLNKINLFLTSFSFPYPISGGIELKPWREVG